MKELQQDSIVKRNLKEGICVNRVLSLQPWQLTKTRRLIEPGVLIVKYGNRVNPKQILSTYNDTHKNTDN